jgi:hypothetical protein
VIGDFFCFLLAPRGDENDDVVGHQENLSNNGSVSRLKSLAHVCAVWDNVNFIFPHHDS